MRWRSITNLAPPFRGRASLRHLNIIEPLHRQHHRSLKRLGAGYGAYRPAHDVDVLLLHQPFVPMQLSVIPIRVIAVDKEDDHEIGLPCAPVPGETATELQSGFKIEGKRGG